MPFSSAKFKILVLATTVLAVLSFKGPKPKIVAPRPNLLIVLVDQWRGQALGFEGKEKVLTPNLDALASKSLVLSQMVSNYPLCSPARAMLLSGKYPLKNHVYSNVNSASAPNGIELPTSIVCWSDILKNNGYANGYIGKWHLDSPHEPYVKTSNNTPGLSWNEWTPPDRRHGFDYWYSYGTYDVHNRPMYWDTKASRDSFNYVDEWGPDHETDKALAFLKNTDNIFRSKDQPFSLVISMNPPHSEYKTVPVKYYDLYKNIPLETFLDDPDIPAAGTPMGNEYRDNIRYYYANMTGVDEQVGRILKSLKENHLDDNTIVVFMADHGNCLGKHDEISKNVIFEESLRIPFIIYWKGHIIDKKDTSFLCSLPDIYPTLLDLLGLENKIPADLDGTSYASHFLTGNGKGADDQYFLGGINSNMKKINSGFRGIRTNRYKLAYVNKNGLQKPYLFDLVSDPFEQSNIYLDQPKEVLLLTGLLKQWLLKTKDSFEIK